MPAPVGAFAQAPLAAQPVSSDAPVGQQKKGSGSQVAVIPFARASKWHIEQSNVQSGIALTGASPQIFNFPIASYGFLSALIVTVQLSGGAGGSTLTFFEDAPYSLISQVQVTDVNGVPIYQLSGFHTYLAQKYGGYRLFANDSVVKGAAFDANTQQTLLAGGPASALSTGPNTLYYLTPSATTANTKFVLPIYFEFGTDGLGKLQAAEYKHAVSVELLKRTIPREPRASRDAVTTTRMMQLAA